MIPKEAPRDQVACEDTVLNYSGAIQKGCGLILLDRRTSAVVATNETLLRDYECPQALEEIFLVADAVAIRQDLANGRLTPPGFYRMLRGESVWLRFFEAGQWVGVDITSNDADVPQLENISQAFSASVGRLAEVHEKTMQSGDLEQGGYFEELTRGLLGLTGFDRVMMYKFDTDLNGKVIAEARKDDSVPSFEGLKFPSSDIPRPARDLFLRNKVRQIIDVGSAPERILPTNGQDGPLVFDQSNSTYRYSAPIHLEYLTNMGVTATLTIGIVVNRRLWGLIACHHQSGPLQVPAATLTLCHVLSDLASNHVARLTEAQRRQARDGVRRVLDNITLRAPEAETTAELAEIVQGQSQTILALMQADGVQFDSETVQWTFGAIPPPDWTETIDLAARDWQIQLGRDVLATSDLHRFCPDLDPKAVPFGGLLHVRSWDDKTLIKAFRRATNQAEVWAGDPDAKLRYADTDPNIMHPRNSFASYLAQTEGCSLPWDTSEIEACQALQLGLRNIEMSFHKMLRARQLKETNAEIRHALAEADFNANHDPLTGLINRRGFERLIGSLSNSVRRGQYMWLCQINVDHFKKINDTHGHLAGDAVLKRIAHLLSQERPFACHVARLGGDEFALLVAADLAEAEIMALCEQLQLKWSEPLRFGNRDLPVSCTLGVTRFVAGAETSDQIIGRADMALYHCKLQQPGGFEFFSPDLEERTKRRRMVEHEIEQALEGGQFVPFFQPQYDVQSRQIVGFEVLLRWAHPKKGLISPDSFLPIAADMGALEDIDQSMFRQAVRTQAEWKEQTRQTIPLSVNVSVDRLRSGRLLSDLNSLGPGARDLTLELLESIHLDDHDADFQGIIEALRATGVGIEIDDFGTGRTSILAVLAVQPDRLKIDRRLIDPIVTDPSARALVRSILQIADQLGIKSVAEGVETSEHISVLSDLKCERVQGFYFGRPQAAAEARNLILKVA